MKLEIFDDEIAVKDEAHLRELLQHRHEEIFGAFWFVIDEPTLALFINDQSAVLYYMSPSDGDAWSMNPAFQGSQDETVDFLLENYELSPLPADAVIPLEKAIAAFIYFFNTQQLSQEVIWR